MGIVFEDLSPDELCDLMGVEPEKERTCTVCGKPMKSGFCVDDGAEYYCSEECLHERYTPEEYGEMYRENMAYWSEWED